MTSASMPSPPPPEIPSPSSQDAVDDHFMDHALRLARRAARRGEVPVGAVAVWAGEVVGAAGNRIERSADATAHAEMLALRQASSRMGSWRLHGVTLYVTLEPCPMCAGALVLARVDRLVYGAADPKKGAVHSVCRLLDHPALNHHPQIAAGVRAGAAAALLHSFFRARRHPRRAGDNRSAGPILERCPSG